MLEIGGIILSGLFLLCVGGVAVGGVGLLAAYYLANRA